MFVVTDASAQAVHDRIEIDHQFRRAGFERAIAQAFRSSAVIRPKLLTIRIIRARLCGVG
jgi:hypothetical protein